MQKRRKIKQNGGQAMIIAVLFFLVIAIIFTVGVVSPILDEIHIANNLILSDQSYYTSESGIEDMSYRLKDGLTVPASGSSDTISLNGATSSTTATAVTGGEQVNSVGDQQNLYRKVQADLAQGSGTAFHYGVQTGVGGISMTGSTKINGNVYAAGLITGNNNGGTSYITGDAVSAGSSGEIKGSQYNQIEINGNAYADTIHSATVGKNAYYSQTFDLGSSVGSGYNTYPNSSDQPVLPLPISDSQISSWETQAQNGGVSSACSGYPLSYPIQGTTVTSIGPIIIPCNLTITGSASTTIAGPVWVQGDFTVSGAAKVGESASLGNNSVPIIADYQANDLTSGEITVGSSGYITGSGKPDSFILLVSQNDSAEQGGNNVAITADGAASGNYTLYAAHGQIQLSGSASLTGVVGYLLSLVGSASVTYNTGLADMIFSSGSTGGYTFSSWGETQ